MPAHESVPAPRYRLGLPAWAYPGWRDRFFETLPSPLASYAEVFDAVEGNTTFYGVPDAATVSAWRDAVRERDFRFSFKLPRGVTHVARSSAGELDDFLKAIAPLDANLGPLLLQFPATVGPREIERYEPVFERLAEDATVRGRCVLEVRHPAFFDSPEPLAPLYVRHGFGRVTLDAHALYAGDPAHPDVVAAAHEKPKLPVLDSVFGGVAFVRLVLHPDSHANGAKLDEWATRTAALLRDGVTVTMMIHCPNNSCCPPFAVDFHERLRRQPGMEGLRPLAPWPVPQQGSLL